MCGIFAGDGSIYDICKGLKHLQYRGCDSWGVGQFTNFSITQYRELGREIDAQKLKDLHWENGFKLGHTRWADTGKVCIENTHPILSYQEDILLVHNGSLSNYEETQKSLEVFTGVIDYNQCVDTKILTDYISFINTEHITTNLINERFQGNYAIVWLDKNHPNRLYFARKDSPLYYYKGLLSSDAGVFDKAFEIPNNSLGYILKYKHQYELWVNNNFVGVIYTPTFSFSTPKNNSENSDDFMLSEIKEQSTFSYEYPDIIDMYSHACFNKIQLIGCGSSYNAALLGKKYFELSKPSMNIGVEYASEFNFYNEGYNSFREIVAISQSGETADTKEVLQKIKEHKYPVHTTLITNHPECSAKNLASHISLMNVGHEQAIAATKSFTATCMMMLAMSNPHAYLDLDLNNFRTLVNNTISLSNDIKSFVFHNNLIHKHSHFNIMSGGLNYPIAREIGLKLREVAQIHIEASVLSNFKHGNLATCDEDSLSIIIMPNNTDTKYNRIINNAKQIKARNGKLLGIGPDSHDIYDFFIKTPKTTTVLQPIINNIAGQLLAYWCAKYKGISPDYCKNLAKAISVY